MKLLGPTRHVRLNEVAGGVYMLLALGYILCLVSYHPADPSLNTATGSHDSFNLIGLRGAQLADLSLQMLGLGAFVIPALIVALAWKWLRCELIEAQFIKSAGAVVLLFGFCTALSLGPGWRVFSGTISPGGVAGILLADWLVLNLNRTGAVLATAAALFVSIYLVSTFSMAKLARWFAGPLAVARRVRSRWLVWQDMRRHRRLEKIRAREAKRRERKEREQARQAAPPPEVILHAPEPARATRAPAPPPPEAPASAATEAADGEIPIRSLEDFVPARKAAPPPPPPAAAKKDARKTASHFRLPSTDLLAEPSGRPPYDSVELKETAARIKAKFEEFNVLGSVVQINPGPVVTTFEFKPEAGIKYNRITALNEDLCLGLQTESVLIERIPGKPTVGIEVPNRVREVISLRQVLESEEFYNSNSPITISLGKDISGRIKVAPLDSMPHLLIAGSTGSGKSVMLNTMIMSMLFKSTPNDVRMIMIDPKRVELGIYEGIPHLLTPVITDPRKATNALKNAVLEMERRLKLLAEQGVRNIEQFNRKVRQLQQVPRNLFEDEEAGPEDLQPLPYILILIDELADLMMIERAGVEEAVTRLAQMARAVGMHLVLATQRPSVDVITGLIKANFPARISFRVATRVDSRTILDVMGSEHLLGKGDMLFLPPGSSRLTRVHGAFVTEREIEAVVDFWKQQAAPDYDQTFLVKPPEDDEEGQSDELDGEADPLYVDAVRVVLEMGKASTSILQRRLRLGYGRAARILDMMQREGIIGPPDGSRPREVLKRPEWLDAAIEQSLH
ncbi:MAG: DNA translocase FtsK 4TM domain-containing protein [Acidobacteria bacterium]|nr:DNA translocase FtsK 4TM domain-containing protein [Acidobacteriota bacterium]